jgi:two-component system cell cycle sensor histidine kinase/response regulator CckA
MSRDLRQRAEKVLARRQPIDAPEGEQGLNRLVHELQVHQVELEMQNEELRRAQAELERTRDRYRQLYDQAPVGYMTLDESGRILATNRRAAGLLTMLPARLLGLDLVRFMDAKEAERFQRYQGELFATGGKGSLELELRTYGGMPLPVLLESTLAIEDGVRRCRMAIIDLSEKRRTEMQLRDREALLAATLDTTRDGIITVDNHGTIESFNPGAERIFGRPAASVIGRPVAILMPPQHADLYRVYLAQVLSGPQELIGHPFQVEGRRDDGSLFPAELTLGDLVIDDRRRLVGVVRDVTDRRRMDEELRESLARFRVIAERLEDVFYILDAASGHPIYVSPAFTQVFGRPFENEGAGAPAWLDAVHPEDVARVRGAIEGACAGAEFDEEYRIVRADAAIRLVRDRAFPAREQNRVIGIIQDVTDERRLEEELRQAQRMESLGTLASGIAHDFNNLLMGLAGFASLALNSLEPEHPAAAYVRRSMEAVTRGASLTRQLLAFSHKRAAAAHSLELDAVVMAAKDLLDRLVGDHVSVVVETTAPGARVFADAGDIEQMLMNLVSNARDAMPNGGSVVVRTAPTTDKGEGDDAGGAATHVALSVRDTGEGMDEATKARVFEPFFTTKAVGKGTGLGLSTVFAVVRRLEGQVRVESQVGQGTTITISLPMAESESPVLGTEAPPAPGHETVLVVEDDGLVRTTVQSYLEALGYRVLCAANADEALRIVDGEGAHVDLTLTDVMMPGRLGGDLARELQERDPEMAILFMSAHPRHELVRLGRINARAPFLGKPFGQDELGIAVHRILAPDAILPSPDKRVPPSLRLLVIEDNADLADSLRESLELVGHLAVVASSGAEAMRIAGELRPHAVLCDLELGGGMSGYDVARVLAGGEAPVADRPYLVALTGTQKSDCNADALSAGFDIVLTKPTALEQIEDLLAGSEVANLVSK